MIDPKSQGGLRLKNWRNPVYSQKKKKKKKKKKKETKERVIYQNSKQWVIFQKWFMKKYG
jgi:hypothetical protein